jgi:methenyltetrahydromethanopterin cyclohydrolase
VGDPLQDGKAYRKMAAANLSETGSVDIQLNETAWQAADEMIAAADALRLGVSTSECGTRIIDCGVKSAGGLEAGRRLAEICLAGLGRVEIEPGRGEVAGAPLVAVQTDQPVLACLASQYAGWQLSGDRFFAMGSGPMRAAAAKEALFADLDFREQAGRVVGILESGKLPTEEICRKIANACGVEPERITLLVARTASLAGTVQVVARTVETALHKLHELKFDLTRIRSGFGVAPLPPVAVDDLAGIGWTNDAVLYGGEVTLWVTGDDDCLQAIGRQVPSCSSRDYGEPFAAVFARAGHDFYKIDPQLFSPGRMTFVNLDSGKTYRFGQLRPDVLAASYGW